MAEPTVTIRAIPKGYSYVRKGNVFITANCRKRAQEAHQKVYLVVSPSPANKPLGIAVPRPIHDAVRAREQDTRAQRAAAVDRRDAGVRTGLETAVRGAFPRIPAADLAQVLRTALQKGKGKVGRTGTLAVGERARLAVRAHIRHGHTRYDAHLRAGGMTQGEAREAVQDEVDAIARLWGKGEPGGQREAARGQQRAANKGKALEDPAKKAKPEKAPQSQERPRQGRTTRSMRSIQQSMQELALRLPEDADRRIRWRDEREG